MCKCKRVVVRTAAGCATASAWFLLDCCVVLVFQVMTQDVCERVWDCFEGSGKWCGSRTRIAKPKASAPKPRKPTCSASKSWQPRGCPPQSGGCWTRSVAVLFGHGKVGWREQWLVAEGGVRREHVVIGRLMAAWDARMEWKDASNCSVEE